MKAGIVFLCGLLAALPAQPAGISPVSPLAPKAEEVELQLPPGPVFEVNLLHPGPIAAREPFLLVFRHANLGAGRALRISLQAETLSPPGARLSWKARNPRGGACRDGSLASAATLPIFDSLPGALEGGCEFLWRLENLGTPRHAGRYTITLHWRIESISAPSRTSTVAGGGLRTISIGVAPPALGGSPEPRERPGRPSRPEERRSPRGPGR